MNIGPIIRAKVGHNRYCGPAALSAIARIDTAKAADVLREVTGKRSIKGVYEGQMVRALNKLGYRALQLPTPKDTTLAAWLKANPLTQRGTKVYLVAAGHHYVTIQGRRGVCNQTQAVVPLAKIKKRRADVQSVYVISKKAELPKPERLPGIKPKAPPKLLPLKTVAAAEAALAKARIAADAALARVNAEQQRLIATKKAVAEQKLKDEKAHAAKVRRDAKKLGVRVERDMGDWWVFGPEAVYGTEEKPLRSDPCEGSHFCTSVIEVTETIEHYLRDLALAAKERG